MTPIAHLAGGYILGEIITNNLSSNSYSELFKQTVIILTSIGAVIPDLDILYYHKNIFKHRDSIIHTPFFWIVGYSIGKLFLLLINSPNNTSLQWYLFSFFVGGISHLFLDWFSARINKKGGVMLFYPLTKKQYGFLPEKNNRIKFSNKILFDKKYLQFYLKNKFLFIIEVAIIIIAGILFLQKIIF